MYLCCNLISSTVDSYSICSDSTWCPQNAHHYTSLGTIMNLNLRP